MMDAFYGRDSAFDGIFVTAVRTTGIFCRPTCSARKPLRENIRFYSTSREALLDGFRPCKRCVPLEPAGQAPEWLQPLLAAVDGDPSRRWKDQDIREFGLVPERVRRWFQKTHGLTFHAYSRARRLGSALGWVKDGSDVTRAAFESGYDSLSGFNEAFRRYFGASPTETTGQIVVQVTRIATPLGPMLVAASDEALYLLEFVDRRALATQIERIRRRLDAAFVPGSNPLTEKVARQVDEYFRGDRTDFDIPLAPAGTEFQCEVWDALIRIPSGQTRSYGELAAEIGRPGAVRAVGKANGDNALAIIIPCHRVVGADGKMVGYGGGVWRKKRLLELERAASD